MILQDFINFFLHLDKNLALIIQSYGTFTYVILFLIIFCETGLVITPFLPGDSLLFAAGALASMGMLNIIFLFFLFSFAAIIGDSVNYWIGLMIGPRVFKEKSRFFKKEYLIKTQNFYEKYGGKAIVLARFIPIVRTFAPFVAGIGKMKYKKFIFYNIVGGIIWVSLFLFAGFFFGKLPFVKNNFTIIIIAIIIISIMPAIFEYFRCKYNEYCLTKKLIKKYTE
jgi:membrane-associated protein